jgi:ABC-type sugar transport system ATPase subunit
MDEPTASLSEREKETLFERLRTLRERGTTIIYISHRLKEIFEIADQITVLRDGQLIDTLAVTKADENIIVNLMIGRTLSDFLHERMHQKRENEVVLAGHRLTVAGQFEDVSFQLHRGEILGFAGLVGAGRSEVFRSVFGSPPPDQGEVLLDGKPVNIKGPVDAIRLGIGYVPEERKRLGLFLIMSVLHNTTFPFLKRLQRFTVIRHKQEQEEAAKLSQRLRIVTPSLAQQVGLLSGGNQQKVILARWLGSGARILILDEPTRGIDVNAKAEIHALIAELAAQDKSIILISSELQELMAIADRIIVMREGRVVGEVFPGEATEEDVLRLAMWGENGSEAQAAPADTAANTAPVSG